MPCGRILTRSREKYYRWCCFCTFQFGGQEGWKVYVDTIWTMLCVQTTGASQRDVVYLGWPIAPSYMSPNAGGWGRGVAGSQPMSTSANEYIGAHEARISFGDLTPYLIYVSVLRLSADSLSPPHIFPSSNARQLITQSAVGIISETFWNDRQAFASASIFPHAQKS
jgi:hypothetical protein